MDAVWIIPVVVLLVGGAALVALLRGTAESARELGAEVARFGELHVSLGHLRTEAQVAGRTIAALHGPGRRSYVTPNRGTE